VSRINIYIDEDAMDCDLVAAQSVELR